MCEFCNLKAIEITPSGIRVIHHCESIINDSTRVEMWKINNRNVLQIYNETNSTKVDIIYCPFCGRKL